MNWRDVWILYRRELRSALRERTIVVNGILMPIFLYPIMLWVMFTGLTFVQGFADGFTSRVAVSAPPPGHQALLDTLRAHEDIELREEPLDTEEAVELVRLGELDAYVAFGPPDARGSALPENFSVDVRFDRSVDRSRRARERVEDVVAEYRNGWVEREAEALGIPPEARAQFLVVRENVATGTDVGALILSILVPLFLVLMVALGCFIPSVDTTAGERERSTWETLMTVSASRLSVVTAKYLLVATLGVVAGLLNVLAIFVSIGTVMAPLLADAGAASSVQFRLDLLAIPVMAAGAVVMALLFAAAMMLLATFARTFKEGQAMVTPIYYLALLPLVLGQQTDRTLSVAVASLPVANVAMMIRDAINGVFLWPLIAMSLAVNLVLVVVCLLLARSVLRFEDLLIGSYDGSFWRWAKDHLLGRKPEREAPTPAS